MILIEPSNSDKNAFLQATIFADQLAHAGYQVCLNIHTMPDELDLSSKFEALPYIRDPANHDISALFIVCETLVEDAKLVQLHQYQLGPSVPVIIFGQFANNQDQISASSKFSYVTGARPVIVNLSDTKGAFAGNSACPCFGVGMPFTPASFARNKRAVNVFSPELTEDELLPGMQALTTSRHLLPMIYTSGKQKSEWMRRVKPGHQIYNYAEISPASLSRLAQILVLTDEIKNNYRAMCLVNNHALSGHPIIDATKTGLFENGDFPVLRGPADPAYLARYLEDVVLPNLDGIIHENQRSGYANKINLVHQLIELGIEAPQARERADAPAKTYFLPTNGVGLGHAQRCALIADAFKGDGGLEFFAFPSCVPMLGKQGYAASPLVSRSALHDHAAANDLLNASRIDTKVQPGDTFVFDGGYIFDSVFRNIIRHDLKAVWIRRGLWPGTQDNSVALDREKVFARVIIPSEAFDALNTVYSSGPHVRQVGPVVRLVDKKTAPETRNAMQKRFGRKFNKLIVTMLGGGVAADLSAHTAATASFAEARDDCLNLIVVWPGAIVPPAWYSWQNSKVVTTHHAGLLAAAADVCVSAVGYNSFHETLYNKVPTIFVPQEASYMDDQAARATTAAEMGLAESIKPGHPTALTRELRRFLDDGKGDEIMTQLENVELPMPGNVQAAQIIEELTRE